MNAQIDLADFKAVMGHFPTGVAVVTAISEESPVGFTCQSSVSVSMSPPLISLAPAKTSTTWPRIRTAASFCVNVLGEDQAGLCRGFARSGTAKFGGVDWRRGSFGAPLIASAVAWIECQLETSHDAGDHEVVIGRVLSLARGEGLR